MRPAFRRRGLGGLLHDASRRDMAAHRIGCMYGAPGAMNLTPLKHGGSRELGHVSRWARPLAASALGVRAGASTGSIAAALKPRVRAAELDPMRPHDPRVDAVWAAARRELRLAAVRDAAFYTWRFLDAPAQRQPRVRDRRRAASRSARARSSRCNEGRVLRIVDLLAAPGAWHACLRAIARSRGRDHARRGRSIIKLMASTAARRAMWRVRLHRARAASRSSCMIPRTAIAGRRSTLVLLRRDSDLDRWVVYELVADDRDRIATSQPDRAGRRQIEA